MKELLEKILGQIKKTPSGVRAYEDLYHICLETQKTDIPLSVEYLKKLSDIIENRIPQSETDKELRSLFMLHKKVLLAAAPFDFESYLLYVEWEREPDKKFYVPRREVMHPVVQAMQDLENGVIGYFDFINIPNYKNLKGVTDPRKYLENIKADGYATSLKYVDNLMRVIETWQLTDYDKKEETKMSNSPLVVYTKLSPNHSGQRTHSIDRITPHCVVGQLSAESICGCFISTSRQASCNYGIGTDGRISMSVEEKNRSWCSSSRENDQRAVTIECASDKTAPYAFNDAVYASLVNLCVDICQRNGKSKLLWLGDKNKTLAYAPKSDEMVLTVHRWFANKSCPGDWLYNRLGNLAAEVTKRLTGGSTYTGKVDIPSDGKTLYRVQTGAFSKRSNADAWAAKLKAAGFDTYIVQMDNLYKVQVGAYSQKSNAENMMAKLKAAGYDAFITTKSGTAAGTAKKSAAEIAKEIYNGTCSDARWSSWGNGADRVNRLKQAGYDPSEVQSEVNKLF